MGRSNQNMGRSNKKQPSGKRTKHARFSKLSPEYKQGDYIDPELEDYTTYLWRGKPVKRRSWKPTRDRDILSVNIDASGAADGKSFGYSYIIRNHKNKPLFEGYGCEPDPCGGKSTTYMETVASSKFLAKVDPTKFPRLEIRCDNMQSVAILDGTRENLMNFSDHEHLEKVKHELQELKDLKYPMSDPAKHLEFEKVKREENFVADHLSHKGKHLGLEGVREMWRKDDADWLKDDWTFHWFLKRDVGIGFCDLDEMKALKLKKHNENKRRKEKNYCRNCRREEGHLQDECKSEPRCWNCNEPGHDSKVCSNQKVKRQRIETKKEEELN